MSSDPSFSTTARALRVTTSRLCAELVTPTTSPPDWTEFQWDIARAVATMHGIAGLLAERLRWSGTHEWQRFLESQRAQGAARDARIAALIAAVDARVARAGIAVVGLKGTALRAYRLFTPGVRPMGDIDLLARREEMPSIARALAECGYHEQYAYSRHQVFDQPSERTTVDFGEHVDNPLKIEVHPVVTEALPRQVIDISSRLWPADPRPGINAYRDAAALLLHLLLHLAGNMRSQSVRLVQLWDVAELSRRLTPHDWTALVDALPPDESPWWMWPPLHLAQRCTSLVVPERVRSTLEAACPKHLASASAHAALHDVSWSNLRVAAFPGIAWSRTVREAFDYARSRIAPGRAALEEVERTTRDMIVARGTNWYGASHLSRIVRWLFTRPRRVHTMFSVRAAIAERTRPRGG